MASGMAGVSVSRASEEGSSSSSRQGGYFWAWEGRVRYEVVDPGALGVPVACYNGLLVGLLHNSTVPYNHLVAHVQCVKY